MATRTITPEQQLENVREGIWQREYELENRYPEVPIRQLMELIRREIFANAFAERVARGEVPTAEVHQCDTTCEQPCPDWDD